MSPLPGDDFVELDPIYAATAFINRIEDDPSIGPAPDSDPEFEFLSQDVEEEFAIAFCVGVAVIDDDVSTRRIVTVAVENQAAGPF